MGFTVANNQHAPDVLAVHAAVTAAKILAYYAVIYMLTRAMNKSEYFWQFLHMSNAYSIMAFIFLLPVFAALYTVGPGGDFYKQYYLFLVFIGLVFNAFIAAKALRLNLSLGGFLATISLLFADAGYRLIMFYADHSAVAA